MEQRRPSDQQAVHNDTTRTTVEQAWERTDASGGPKRHARRRSNHRADGPMLLAHIFGIPVEETALTFAPAIVAFIATARAYSHQVRRKLRFRMPREGQTTTSDPRVDSRPPDSSGSAT